MCNVYVYKFILYCMFGNMCQFGTNCFFRRGVMWRIRQGLHVTLYLSTCTLFVDTFYRTYFKYVSLRLLYYWCILLVFIHFYLILLFPVADISYFCNYSCIFQFSPVSCFVYWFYRECACSLPCHNSLCGLLISAVYRVTYRVTGSLAGSLIPTALAQCRVTGSL